MFRRAAAVRPGKRLVRLWQAAQTQVALDRLAGAIADARPDVVLIIGDDQEELYQAGNTPALAIYCGDELVMRPLGEILSAPPAWMATATA